MEITCWAPWSETGADNGGAIARHSVHCHLALTAFGMETDAKNRAAKGLPWLFLVEENGARAAGPLR